jgi:hypothetical protein
MECLAQRASLDVSVREAKIESKIYDGPSKAERAPKKPGM